MFKRRLLLIALTLLSIITINASDPTATTYAAEDCQGTYKPYPFPTLDAATVPDSLEAVMINHVGRHGSRYLSSDRNITYLRQALTEANANGALTTTGKRLLSLTDKILAMTNGQWGALDSLGVYEMQQLAVRMSQTFPGLLGGDGNPLVEARSSYSPRCILSMYSFVYQLSRLNNKLEITTSSGRKWSEQLRPFDSDPYYIEYKESGTWRQPVEELRSQILTTSPVDRIFTREYLPRDVARFLEAEYQVVASAGALGLDCALADYFTQQEYNALWAVSNLDHYLRYSASTLSIAPAEMASPLLLDLVTTTEGIVNATGAVNMPKVILRFGHAETLMPLLAQLHIPGCYYMTNYFDTVASHWRDFNIVPMASNFRLILFKHKGNGKYYVRVDLNETPVPLIPGRSTIYTPWETAKDYMIRCLPLIFQP